jgi:hypothetical protein
MTSLFLEQWRHISIKRHPIALKRGFASDLHIIIVKRDTIFKKSR